MKAHEKYLKWCKQLTIKFEEEGIYNPCYITGYQPFNPSSCLLSIPTKGIFQISKKTAKSIIYAFDHEGGLSGTHYYNLKKHETSPR